ncbi:MAG: glutamate 5-kinase [Candidatus Ancillula sp.]|jgi:glutamate 5-kinase|nr:glutamate 5-kinase [Candidatus Ancillula sp.]
MQNRIVIKIGSSSLTNSQGLLDQQKLFGYSEVISRLHSQGFDIILVSSGAVAAGLAPLGLKERPNELSTLQAASAVGQASLMLQYERAFSMNQISIGQVLLTRRVLDNEQENARNTLEKLLTLGAIPIVNENDTVATEELTFGDNDQLAAEVATLVEANILFLFTDVDGLYTENPRNVNAKKINIVQGIDELNSIKKQIDVSELGSKVGTGGMQTKLRAVDIALSSGVDVVMAKSLYFKECLFDVLENDNLKLETKFGTRFYA